MPALRRKAARARSIAHHCMVLAGRTRWPMLLLKGPGEALHVHKSINICLNEQRRRKNVKWKKKKLTAVLALFAL